eukprot:5194847-Pleurochrysis_carterae.AAC.4
MATSSGRAAPRPSLCRQEQIPPRGPPEEAGRSSNSAYESRRSPRCPGRVREGHASAATSPNVIQMTA